MPLRKLSHDAYRVGWICPLEVEQVAAMEMLDEEHQRLPQLSADTNIYNLGSINNHNVVIAGLPRAGNCPAATVVAQMRLTFPRLQYGMLVGIGGGVPVKTKYGMIRLGHVVVSQPTGIHSGAIQYDHGKAHSGLFERKGSLAPPPTVLQNAVREVSVRRQRSDQDPIQENVRRIDTNRRTLRKFAHPGLANDRLYLSSYKHQQKGLSCEDAGCDPEQRIDQRTDAEDEPLIVIHRGTIASGELVIKDSELRDSLARRDGVICFEMEAAGALADFPCIVIRGISDYCDTHKNDIWHGYAAAVAAAYARELLFHASIIETRISIPSVIGQSNNSISRRKDGKSSAELTEEFIQAVRGGKVEIVQSWLDRVDVNSRDARSGRTALSFAAEAGYLEIARMLLDHNALVNVRQYTRPGDKSVVNASWTGGRTELAWAVCRKHAEMTELLLKHGSNPNAANSAGRTPIHHACITSDIRTIRILLDYGADVNHRSYHNGWAPIHEIVERKSSEILRLVLEYDPVLDVHMDKNGQAPLHTVVFNKNTEFLRMLLDKGADPNIRMAEDITPLHLAATIGWVEGIDILASSNATIDCKDSLLKETPLHKAARNRNFECCLTLINHGAYSQELNIDGQDYESILSLARQYKYDWQVDPKKGYFLQSR